MGAAGGTLGRTEQHTCQKRYLPHPLTPPPRGSPLKRWDGYKRETEHDCMLGTLGFNPVPGTLRKETAAAGSIAVGALNPG